MEISPIYAFNEYMTPCLEIDNICSEDIKSAYSKLTLTQTLLADAYSISEYNVMNGVLTQRYRLYRDLLPSNNSQSLMNITGKKWIQSCENMSTYIDAKIFRTHVCRYMKPCVGGYLYEFQYRGIECKILLTHGIWKQMVWVNNSMVNMFRPLSMNGTKYIRWDINTYVIDVPFDADNVQPCDSCSSAVTTTGTVKDLSFCIQTLEKYVNTSLKLTIPMHSQTSM